MTVVFINCPKKLYSNYYGKDESMMEEHSVNLLRECDSGCKMAAESLEQIRDMVSDQELWKDITESYEKHQALDAKIKKTLSAMEEKSRGKWPPPGPGCPQKCG